MLCVQKKNTELCFFSFGCSNLDWTAPEHEGDGALDAVEREGVRFSILDHLLQSTV